jgi:HEAT repeat protein
MALLAAACGPTPAEQPGGPEDPVWTAEALLYGTSARCHDGADCPTGVCFRGFCGGYLDADGLWAQQALARFLRARAEADPALAANLTEGLDTAAQDERRTALERARAAILLTELAKERGAPVLHAFAKSDDPSLALRANIALAATGDADAAQRLLPDLGATSEVVQIQILRALAQGRSPVAEDALTAVLTDPKAGPSVRLAAAESLGPIAGTKGRAALQAILADPVVGYLHYSARAALAQTEP